MRLYLIRHAKPAANSGDVGLGPDGGRQAAILAKLFQQLAPERATLQIVSSDLKRARETATVLCGALGVASEDVATFPAPIDSDPSFDLADRMMKRLRLIRSQGKQTVLLVGHSDYLTKALAWLTGDDGALFPPLGYAAVACLDCQDSFDKATGVQAWFLVPVT
jgi:broad specificity phosphatase PhoE